MSRIAVSFLLLLMIVSSAAAQRRFAVVEPTKTDPTLVFDINEIPIAPGRSFATDLNFAPKVVFTLDGTRAFVSFPSTDKVAVFDPKTGDVLSVIQVATNPSELALTPDGRKLAVPCIFARENLPNPDDFDGARIGAISIIDVETLEVQTINFTETLLSIANNIVFSADGSTGFIASGGTDELIRFDLETAQEISPRLQFPSGTRPISLTMAQDFSFLGVVLVGSGALSPFQTPDSVQIVDTQAFTITKDLSFTVEPGEFPFDFRADNTVAFSHDGKFALIGEQAASRASGGLSFVPDRALLIDLEAEELVSAIPLGTGFSGGIAGAAYTTPDGRFFVLRAFNDLVVVNIETQDVLDLVPAQAQFQPTTRPAFSDDGLMFIGTPLTDFLLTFRPATGEVTRGLSIGGRVERTVSNQVLGVSSAPMDVAISPDGQIISVLNFNANTIELFRPTFSFFGPELNSSGEFSTGLALTNIAEEAVDLDFVAFNGLGIRLIDDPDTPDNVEFQELASVTVEPHEQINFTSFEVLQPDPVVDINAWLNIDSDRDSMVGMFLTFDSDVSRLDGGAIGNETSSLSLVSEIRVDGDFKTELIFVNPNFSSNSAVTITLFDFEGNQVAQAFQSVFPFQRVSAFLNDPDPDDPAVNGIFDQSVLTDFPGGYVLVVGSGGLIGYERTFDNDTMSVLSAQSLIDNPLFTSTTRFSVPHVVAFQGADTILRAIQLGTQENTVTLTLRGDQGQVLAGPVERTLGVQTGFQASIIELFELVDQGATVTGWVDIESSVPGLMGSAEISGSFGQTRSSLAFQAPQFKRLIFPHVAEVPGLNTGLALLNTGAEPASMQIDLRRMDGTVIESVDVVLQSGERLLDVVQSVFPSLAEALEGGSIEVRSDQDVMGLEMFFSNKVLSAVPFQGFDQ